jgi:hypothetical protein
MERIIVAASEPDRPSGVITSHDKSVRAHSAFPLPGSDAHNTVEH